MAKYGKWVAGGLGWVLGGPIGALVGFLFGSMYDSMQAGTYEYKPISGDTSYDPPRSNTRPGDFEISLLVLAAAVMKADNKLLKSELDYIKEFFNRSFGSRGNTERLKMLKQILEKDINLYEVCNQIRYNMDYASRLQLIHFLFGIARADGVIPDSELNIIKTASGYLSISAADFDSIRAMFVPNTHSDYKILEIDENISDEDLKKAYKRMAMQYHPDKVSHLGPEVHKQAEKKFQELNAAFERIKKQRGMK